MLKLTRKILIKLDNNLCCDKTNKYRSKINSVWWEIRYFKKIIKTSNEMSSQFDVKLAVKRVAYFQTVCPDFIVVLYISYYFLAIKTICLISFLFLLHTLFFCTLSSILLGMTDTFIPFYSFLEFCDKLNLEIFWCTFSS
jgi:hypothetical protein